MNHVLRLNPGSSWFSRFGKTLGYALYVIFHPFDGFWDLAREKRGSLAAAHVITFLLILIEIMRLTLTNFQFVSVYKAGLNVVTVILRILLPMFLWTTANWSLTTLMDGKGRLPEVYMATAYAFTPYVIINAALILFSHLITNQEGSIYFFFSAFAIAWSVFLLLAAMMMIHSYSIGKTIFSSFLTIVGMGVMVFIFLIFFGLITDAITYCISLYKEIMLRLL